ncbi:MAG: FAD-dependent oxidoreductase [Armatimonadota bacterium]|nr:FAD-dependent oxidoreductase [Armatimonadota bacterium]
MSGSRIVVIGGVACGPKAAARARRRDPKAEITIIERGDLLSYAGCGMPYYIQGQVETTDELMMTPAGALRDEAFFKGVKAINVMSRTLAERIDRQRKVVEVVSLETAQKQEIPYDKLVLATGADAAVPPCSGVDLKGVFRLNHPHDAEGIRKAVAEGCKEAVIVGAGLIGVEVAEALVTQGLRVTMIEMLPSIVPAVLDSEMAAHLQRHLESRGVTVLTDTRVLCFEGDDRGAVREVVTDKGNITAQLVLIAIGVRPNVKLAQDAGLELGETGAIKVNEHLQTSDPCIYAGGDCVESVHLITGKPIYAPLGSTANKHGRVIGDNVTGGNTKFEGVLGTVVFKAFDFNVGKVGLSESDCKKHGIPCVTAVVPGPDRAHYYPAAKPVIMKMIAHSETGKLLGVQALGTGEVVKRIDVAATAITFGIEARDVSDLDLGYAPPYSTAVDIIQHAANVVDNKLLGLAKSCTPQELKSRLDANDDFVLLDVRTPAEVEAQPFRHERVVHIPLGKLRERAGELPRDKEFVIFCKTSMRAWEAQRILEGEGFTRVCFLDGGLAAWPYEIPK